MNERTRCLRAPVGFVRNGDLAHRVGFKAVRGGVVWSG
jgi:hypothetical protein